MYDKNKKMYRSSAFINISNTKKQSEENSENNTSTSTPVASNENDNNEVQTSAANFIFGPDEVENNEANVDKNVDEKNFSFVSVPVRIFQSSNVETPAVEANTGNSINNESNLTVEMESTNERPDIEKKKEKKVKFKKVKLVKNNGKRKNIDQLETSNQGSVFNYDPTVNEKKVIHSSQRRTRTDPKSFLKDSYEDDQKLIPVVDKASTSYGIPYFEVDDASTSNRIPNVEVNNASTSYGIQNVEFYNARTCNGRPNVEASKASTSRERTVVDVDNASTSRERKSLQIDNESKNKKIQKVKLRNSSINSVQRRRGRKNKAISEFFDGEISFDQQNNEERTPHSSQMPIRPPKPGKVIDYAEKKYKKNYVSQVDDRLRRGGNLLARRNMFRSQQNLSQQKSSFNKQETIKKINSRFVPLVREKEQPHSSQMPIRPPKPGKVNDYAEKRYKENCLSQATSNESSSSSDECG